MTKKAKKKYHKHCSRGLTTKHGGKCKKYTLDSALGAREWLDGDESSRPSESWAPLVVD